MIVRYRDGALRWMFGGALPPLQLTLYCTVLLLFASSTQTGEDARCLLLFL